MSYEVSGSENDRVDDQETSQNSQDQHTGGSYKCPEDFVSFEYKPSSSALLENEHTELWLIKAPCRFDPETFSDLKLSLSGLKTIQTSRATPQIYSVLGSHAASTDLHLLTSSCKNQDVSLSTSSFMGILSISENYGDCMRNQNPRSIPTAPAPCVPPGLRQRFQPFGCSTASPSPLKRATLLTEGCDKPRKKKKKKTAKHGKNECDEVLTIKQESVSHDYEEIQEPEAVEDDGTVERRRRKKKKKDKHKEDEVTVDASLIPKQEIVDTSYGDTDGSVKKKKKKKKLDG